VLTAIALLGCSSKTERAAPAPTPVAAAPGDAAPAPRDVAPAPSPAPHFEVFADEGAAIAHLLESKPRILAFGEYHEVEGAAPVRSALERFRATILPVVAPATSDLIVEMWARDACGAKSETANRNVQATTQRPAATENQAISLMKAALALGVTNHVLPLGCDDYDSFVDATGEVDYEKLLVLVARKLYARADQVLRVRDTKAPKPDRPLVLMYGGAVHNNAHPYESVAELSYAVKLQERAGGRLIEIDLYVPEYIADDELFQSEDWYPVYQKHAGADHVVLIRRAADSYILILKQGLLRPKP
jgi:hypothetical protein